MVCRWDKHWFGWIGNKEYLMKLKVWKHMFNPRFVILHHSNGKPLHEIKGAGYHYVIEKVNDNYEIIMDQSLIEMGAHCQEGGLNFESIGVCFVGNFDKHAPSLEQFKAGVKLAKVLMGIFNIPVKNVVGHRKYSTKSCPGRFFDTSKFRSMLL